MFKKVLFGGAGGGDWPAEIGLLVLRVWTGLALAIGHGWGKFSDPSGFVENVEGAGFPVPFVSGWLAMLGEFVGGILLALGLFTRPAALWISCVMAGAVIFVHANDPLFMSGGRAKEPALLFLAPAICFLLAGSGQTGLDRFARRAGKRKG